MNVQIREHSTATRRKLPFECIALVLQGGGALGAYQAGVYEALAEAGIHPDWIAGISIGAINAAIIAGNPLNSRVDRLREFWTQVSSDGPFWCFGDPNFGVARADMVRSFLNKMSAGFALAGGARNFFAARPIPPWLQSSGTIEATSFYDTSSLRRILERLVDFDRVNAGIIRFSVGAVNVRTGNFLAFDSATHTIGPEHVMASGALPPGFPAVQIEGEHYWDGGLVSNTPLQWVVDAEPRRDTLAFQVDLWSARGEFPRNMFEVMTREKEIRYTSRTRAGTDQFKHIQKMRYALAGLLENLPEDLKSGREAQLLGGAADRAIVHLIYRPKTYEGHSKDYEFSRLCMEEHWKAGYRDARRTLRHPEILERPTSHEGVSTFDLYGDGRD